MGGSGKGTKFEHIWRDKFGGVNRIRIQKSG